MDAREFNQCVRDWSDAVFRFARRCTGSAEDARDAVQTAFAALWEARNAVPAAKAKAYLFQVAYRQAVDAHHHNRRTMPEEFVQESPAQSGTAELRRTLDAALDRLDDQSRALVLLKDWEGYRYEEIARITGLSDAQVRVYLHRARKTLKTYLISVETVLS